MNQLTHKSTPKTSTSLVAAPKTRDELVVQTRLALKGDQAAMTGLSEAVSRAQNGDEAALPALREVLQSKKSSELLDLLGNLAGHAERMLVTSYAGKNLAFKEAIARKLVLLRAELTGPTSTPLERLLVDRVVACWLHLHHLETKAGALQMSTDYQRCLNASQKRYLAAIKTLALVRRLAVPLVQVNIAKKQVNVGSMAGGSITEG